LFGEILGFHMCFPFMFSLIWFETKICFLVWVFGGGQDDMVFILKSVMRLGMVVVDQKLKWKCLA